MDSHSYHVHAAWISSTGECQYNWRTVCITLLPVCFFMVLMGMRRAHLACFVEGCHIPAVVLGQERQLRAADEKMVQPAAAQAAQTLQELICPGSLAFVVGALQLAPGLHVQVRQIWALHNPAERDCTISGRGAFQGMRSTW